MKNIMTFLMSIICSFIFAQNNINVSIAKDVSAGNLLSDLQIKTTITNNNSFDIIISGLSITDDFGNAISNGGSSYIIATGYNSSNNILITSNKFNLIWYPENCPKTVVKLSSGESYSITHPLYSKSVAGMIGLLGFNKIVGLSQLEIKLYFVYIDTKNNQRVENFYVSNRIVL